MCLVGPASPGHGLPGEPSSSGHRSFKAGKAERERADDQIFEVVDADPSGRSRGQELGGLGREPRPHGACRGLGARDPSISGGACSPSMLRTVRCWPLTRRHLSRPRQMDTGRADARRWYGSSIRSSNPNPPTVNVEGWLQKLADIHEAQTSRPRSWMSDVDLVSCHTFQARNVAWI